MKIIAGNWKMNGSRDALSNMITALRDVDTENTIILCVPYTMLGMESGRVHMGAQDTSAHDHGAFTGEISAHMISDTGAKYVIVGHSERRAYHNETNDIVRQKATMALSNGLTPIICVGETMDEKQAGKTMEIIQSGVRESVPTDATGNWCGPDPNGHRNCHGTQINRGHINVNGAGRNTCFIRRQCQGFKRRPNNVDTERRRCFGWWRILETGRLHTYNNQC